MAQYLDYDGLHLYDVLIKTLIKNGNDELVAKINGVLGGSDVNVSISDIISIIGDVEGNKSIAEILNGLTDAVETLNGDSTVDGSVKKEIAALRDRHNEDINDIRSYVAELLGSSDIEAGDIISMSEVALALKRLEEVLGISEDTDGEPSVIDRVEALEDGSVYVPSQLIQDANMTSIKHEGLPATSASDFAEKKYTYSEMFDMILFPTLAPVKTDPSLSWKNVANQDVLVGTDITNLVITDENLESHLNYNLGSWTYNKGMKASNGHGDPSFTSEGLSEPIGDTYEMPAETIRFKASVEFLAGDDPKNNKGIVQEGMGYTGGTKYTSYYTLTPYYNWYASTVTGGVLTEQQVISGCGITDVITGDTSKPASSTNGTLLVAHKYGVEEQSFSIPRAIIEFWQFNTASGAWVKFDLTDGVPAGWVKTRDTNMDAGIEYYTYTYKGPDNDPIYIILKF